MHKFLTIAIAVCALGVPCVRAQNAASPIDIRDLMTATEFHDSGLQKLSDQELRSLNAWLSKFVTKAVLGMGGVGSSSSFAELEGAIIVADDGQFLGTITTKSIDAKSITNSIGLYGSEISSTSIFNEIGKYGGEISRLSPFNSITSTPARVYKGDRFVGFLTVNTIKSPGSDPRALVGWLKSQQ